MAFEDELFRSIYKRYMPLIRVIAKNRGIPFDDIEDIVQEVFASYYSHYPLDWPGYRIKAVLAQIARNRCVDYLRRQDTHPVTCYDPLLMQDENFMAGDMLDRDSLSILLERQEYREVAEALRTMREDWAQVFLLYVIEGRPMDEVSRILGTTEAACRTRLTRGRKYMREHFNFPEPEQRRNSALKRRESPIPNLSDPSEIPGSV